MIDRRAPAVWAMRQFCRVNGGFELPPVTEFVNGDSVELHATAPDGRKFGIAFNVGGGVDRSCRVSDPNGAHSGN